MTFLDRIKAVDPARIALVTDAGHLTFGDLAQTVPQAGLRLVLNTPDVALALRILLAMDGNGGQVTLSSPSLDAETLSSVVAQVGATLVRGVADSPPQSESFRCETFGAGRTDWLMMTSGTTGVPKLVQHSLESLTRSTRMDTVKGAGQVWGLLYDYTRFAGLQVVLQSLLSGATLVAPSTDLPLDVRISKLVGTGCTHLSATPTLWRKILMTPGHQALRLRQITLGGEIADDAVIGSLSRAYPDARISHIFASTEAGVGFSVTDRRMGFPVSYLTDPPMGIALRVVDDHLHVRNEAVGAAYLGGQGAVAQDGWVNTGDVVEVLGDRVLFRGRSSGVINVGGDKVHPEEVERAVLSHPSVRLARIYAKMNPIVGALVAADIVAQADVDTAALREELKGYLAARLDRHMVPAFIRFVPDFDTNAAGKLKRT
jgi:acyl-CoA synthetase (AMP-forming)/AMP-acid ligase II